MKYLLFVICLFLVVPLEAKTITTENGDVTFNVPDDFTPLTPEEITAKFKMKNGAMDVVGNQDRGVTISYRLSDTALQPDQLPDMQSGMSGALGHVVPGIQWIKNEITEINGTKWVYFEFLSGTKDPKIHSIQLATSYQGKMYLVNFSTTVPLFDASESELRSSYSSVKIKTDSSTPSPSGDNKNATSAPNTAPAK